MSEVAKFYDEFTTQQSKAGINNRHLSIIDHLEALGLRSDHRVLEVGCGIGTVSQLILRSLSSRGYLHAVDISNKSIELAKERLKKYANVKLEVKDLTTEKIADSFDVIVLPDVIEHIPLSQHTAFFQNLFALLKENGFVFIHIPHPNNLEWMVDQGVEGLQIIDQPIFTDQLCATIYPIGWFIDYLKSYSVYAVDHDYQVIVLKKKPARQDLTNLRQFYLSSFTRRMLRKMRYVLRGMK